MYHSTILHCETKIVAIFRAISWFGEKGGEKRKRSESQCFSGFIASVFHFHLLLLLLLLQKSAGYQCQAGS
jgi:hypothetical protein